MPFCSQCGTQLLDNMRFCPSCGSPKVEIGAPKVTAPPKSDNMFQQTIDIRNQSLEEINRMIEYFGNKQVLYDEYEQIQYQIEKLNPQPDPNETWLQGYLRSYRKNFLPFIFIVPLILFGATVASTGGAGILAGLLFIGIGVLLFIYVVNKHNTKTEEIDQSYQSLSRITNELKEHYRSYGPCAVGYEFSNPKILEEIAHIIECGRADTIKEALNRLLEDHHRTYMEIQADMAVRAARQAAISADLAAIAVLCNPKLFN